MTIIKPIELANVCSIFPSLKTTRLPSFQLTQLVENTKLIDSDSSVFDILFECVDCGLLVQERNHYVLSPKGKKLCKCHPQPGYFLSIKAKDIFIKQILLDTQSERWCCSEFLSRFFVDTIIGTFVYYRNNPKIDDTRWLITLSSVGLIEVYDDKALINKEYISLINDLLLKIRNPIQATIDTLKNEKKEIGDLAEDLAFKYEKGRLISAGFTTLASLVEHISPIDQSAGYDIRSFSGINPNPNENIFIEVKGTRAMNLKFIWSFNEMNVAKEKKEHYWIYGYTEVNLNDKSAKGPITIQNPTLNLELLGYDSVPMAHYITSREND